MNYVPPIPVVVKTARHKTDLVDFYYPMVKGMVDRKVEQRINYQIIELMNTLINKFDQTEMTTYITGGFDIKANERNVLSLVLHALGDFGGAHPMTYIGALNIDIKNGANYPLQAQFKPDSDYVKILSDIIKEQIKEREYPTLEEFDSIKPDQTYYIADNLLVIYFDLYDIAPYAAGFPYFPIPLYQIQDMLAEDGLLNRVTYII